MALDPVEVTRLLEAAPEGPWEAHRHLDEGGWTFGDRTGVECIINAYEQWSGGYSAGAQLDISVEVAALIALLPELAEDWLRLRAIGQKIIDSAPELSMTSDRTAPTVFTLHVSVVLEPAELALLQSLAGVSEGNPE